jgi:phosphotransferase system  glucose/maltose/N-acetylglucosamine-specific IIC component
LVLSSTIGDGLKGGFLLFDRVDPLAFAVGLWDWTKLFNDDVITFYLLIFVIAVLIAIRKKPNAMAVLAMIIGLIMVHPVLLGFTGYDSWDYRFLPVVCFVSIGFGFFVKYYPEVIEKFKTLGKSAKSSSSYHVDDEQSKANSI